MEALDNLPISVGACTNVLNLQPETLSMTNAELAGCFLEARRSNAHTRPLMSNPKEVKKALERLDSFHSSQLDTFLYGYLFPNEDIPDSTLDAIREMSVNGSTDWMCRCQNLAVSVLSSELEARAANVIPRPNPDDPYALPQLRQKLPAVKNVPEVTIGTCNFFFTGTFSSDPDENAEVFSAKVKVRNKGSHAFTLQVSQTQTVIDGVRVVNKFVETSVDKQVVNRGESVDVKLQLMEAPRAGFSEFQQLLVLSIDGVLKLFITMAVVAPNQRIFRQRFPQCLPLLVKNSPLGPFHAPLMLQVFKYYFVKQKGFSSMAVAHLFAGTSVNFKLHNQEIMAEAVRVKEILSEQMNVMSVLNSFWDSQPDARKAPRSRRYCPPTSSAQPPGYLPGIDVQYSTPSSSSVALFPNEQTRVPDVLTRAPPQVIMGVILIWLAEMDIRLFDASTQTGTAVGFMETMPPYLRGVLMWVIDLCCGLLKCRPITGVSARTLALTFAAVLARPPNSSAAVAEDTAVEEDTAAVAAAAPELGSAVLGSSFDAAVAYHQSVVTMLLHLITIYNFKYDTD